MKTITALVSGLIFGIGLIVAGMANPAVVLAFLDLSRPWNPSLAFVMVGAIAVATGAFAWAKRRERSLLNQNISLPRANQIDRALLGGAALFGAGWGLAGICPGPAFVLAGTGATKGFYFIAAMIAGFALHAVLTRKQ
jgi:uncharacterized protein